MKFEYFFGENEQEPLFPKSVFPSFQPVVGTNITSNSLNNQNHSNHSINIIMITIIFIIYHITINAMITMILII